MPIDASIPLQAQAPNIDAMGLLGKVMSFRQQQQQMDLQKQSADALNAERTAQTEARQLEIATRQKVAAGQSALADAIKAHIKPGDDGLPQVDHQAVATTLMQGGFPEQAEAWLKTQASTAESLDKLNASRRSTALAGNEYLGDLAVTAREHDYDPHVITAGVAQAAAQGLIPEARARDILAQFDADPSSAKGLIDQLITPGASERQTKRSKESAEARKTAAEAKNLETYGRATPPEGQKATFLLDGKSVEGAFVPSPTGGRYTYNNEDVTGRAKPVPTATQIRIDTAAKAPNMPAWALDDTRPSGPEGNKPDPTIRMTPNGLHQAALTYIATGQMPPTGRGSDAIAVAQREAINSKVGAIAASAGMDVPALRAFYKTNQASLTQQQKAADAVQGFMATADKNAELLKATLKKIPDLGIPVFNKPLRAFTKSVEGDQNLSKFATYLQSVQNEYARIISQPNLSGQLTDSARHEAEALIDPKATVPQIVASIEALQQEGTNRMVSIGEQIQRIQQRMTVNPAAPPSKAGAGAPITVGGFTVEVVK